MKKVFLLTALVFCTAVCLLNACKSGSAEVSGESENKEPESKVSAARGEYLVTAAGGCDDCHSPKRMGEHGPELIPELRLSGYPAGRPLKKYDNSVVANGWVLFNEDLTSYVGPWGVSFSANITSDETGIGNWTEDHFVYAIRKGKLKGLEGSRNILPPMPWEVLKNMTDDDLKSIFAYLKTVPPVKNIVPAPIPPTQQ